MKSKLSLHIMNWDPVDRTNAFIERVQPPLIKVMQGGMNDSKVEEVKRNLAPGTLVVGRVYFENQHEPKDENLTTYNPVAAAQEIFAGMQESISKMGWRVDVWEGINEIAVDDNGPLLPKHRRRAQLLSALNVELARLMHAAGTKFAAYSFSTGNPNHIEIWDELIPALLESDYLALHEYIYPGENYQAPDLSMCNRYREVYKRLPVAARKKILITECGADLAGRMGRDGGGFKNKISEAQYWEWLTRYDRELMQDPYVVGATVYTYGTSTGWETYDISGSFAKRMMNEIAKRDDQPAAVEAPPMPSVPTNPPQPTAPTAPATPTQPAASGDVLPLAKARWFVEEAIRQLEANNGSAAHEILRATVTPWFYQTSRDHSTALENAQAQTTARWNCEEATRCIEQGKLSQAHDILRDHVLTWLYSAGPGSLGVLSFSETAPAPPAPKRKTKKQVKKPKTGKKKSAAPKSLLLSADGTVASAPPVGAAAAPVGFSAAPAPTLRDALLGEGDARQVLKFNVNASLQKRMLADGLVPNSAEFQVTVLKATYVAQRAEHLLTGEVRVYYAPTTDFGNVNFVMRGSATGRNTPFKGGNRITQVFGARPEYYKQFKFAGHEGIDLVPKDGDRDLYAIEGGEIIKDVDVPGDPKVNAYGIYVVIYNRENARTWYYCHMVEDYVSKGQIVQRGDKIGRMGGTGNVQGDHLHLNMRTVDAVGLPKNPNNGFKGLEDPMPVMDALNAADATSALRDALLMQGEASQAIAFNTQAALQKQIFADAFCPNSMEFNVSFQGIAYVAQRAENLNTGTVRVYYAPTTDFNKIEFVER